jgi:hypothetical protein
MGSEMSPGWASSAFFVRDGALGMAVVTSLHVSCLAYRQLTKERKNASPTRIPQTVQSLTRAAARH